MAIPTQQTQNPPVGRIIPDDVASRKPATVAVMSLLIPEGVSPPQARRLVVLVPDVDLDETALSRRIWTLAAPNRLDVLYLGLCRNASDEPQARRRLATVAALTRDDWVHVKTTLAVEADWLGALRPLHEAGDLIVCHAEQARPSWRGHKPLGAELSQTLKAPVHVLSGFYSAEQLQSVNWSARLLFWGGSAAILAGAFWVQVQISALPKNWAASALMILSVVLECGLIGLWNRAFN